MQALRQIVNVKNNMLQVALPVDFKADTVEIIVLPIEKQKEPLKLKNSKRFFGAISTKTEENLHKHLNKVHNEWERDVR